MKKLLGCFSCLMLLVFLAAPAAAYDTQLAAVDKGNPAEYPYAPGLGETNTRLWLEGIIGATTDQIPYVGTSFDPGFGWTYAVVHIGGGSSGTPDLFAFIDDDPAGGDDVLNPANYPWATGVSFVRYYGPHSVPEPATLLLLGTGLIVLAGFGRNRFKK